MAPIKVRGRFATAFDTAETLGVSPARTRELINTARALTADATHRHSRSGEFVRLKNGRTASSRRKSSRTNASNRKARSRRVKSGR